MVCKEHCCPGSQGHLESLKSPKRPVGLSRQLQLKTASSALELTRCLTMGVVWWLLTIWSEEVDVGVNTPWRWVNAFEGCHALQHVDRGFPIKYTAEIR